MKHVVNVEGDFKNSVKFVELIIDVEKAYVQQRRVGQYIGGTCDFSGLRLIALCRYF